MGDDKAPIHERYFLSPNLSEELRSKEVDDYEEEVDGCVLITEPVCDNQADDDEESDQSGEDIHSISFQLELLVFEVVPVEELGNVLISEGLLLVVHADIQLFNRSGVYQLLQDY